MVALPTLSWDKILFALHHYRGAVYPGSNGFDPLSKHDIREMLEDHGVEEALEYADKCVLPSGVLGPDRRRAVLFFKGSTVEITVHTDTIV